jgi:NAD(P)-dependent dehydrogenase (short-subunit alcohol dehydrogenase family)
VSSVGHRRGTLDLDDLGFERGYAIMKAYSRSKLANILFTSELARRLAGTGVTANCLHPGAVDTNIWSGAPLWAKPIIGLFFRRFFIDAERGASYVVALAVDPALDGVSGAYFEEEKRATPAPLAQDEVLARRLWEASARLVGLAADQAL